MAGNFGVRFCRYCGKAFRGEGDCCGTCRRVFGPGKNGPPPAEKKPLSQTAMLFRGTAVLALAAKQFLFPAGKTLAAAQALGALNVTLNGVPFRFAAISPFAFSGAFRQWQARFAGEGEAAGREIILSLPEDAAAKRQVVLDSELPELNRSAHVIYRSGGEAYDVGRITDGSHRRSKAAVLIESWDQNGVAGRLSGKIELNGGETWRIENGNFRAGLRQER